MHPDGASFVAQVPLLRPASVPRRFGLPTTFRRHVRVPAAPSASDPATPTRGTCGGLARTLGSPQGVCHADAPTRLRVTTERRSQRTPVTAHTSADPKGTWTWSPNSVCPHWSTALRLCSVMPRLRFARYQGACVARHRCALDGPCSGSPAEMAILRGTAAMGRGVGSPSHRSFNGRLARRGGASAAGCARASLEQRKRARRTSTGGGAPGVAERDVAAQASAPRSLSQSRESSVSSAVSSLGARRAG